MAAAGKSYSDRVQTNSPPARMLTRPRGLSLFLAFYCPFVHFDSFIIRQPPRHATFVSSTPYHTIVAWQWNLACTNKEKATWDARGPRIKNGLKWRWVWDSLGPSGSCMASRKGVHAKGKRKRKRKRACRPLVSQSHGSKWMDGLIGVKGK